MRQNNPCLDSDHGIYENDPSARSTAAITTSAGISCRQRLVLATCRSQPSSRHGTHSPSPCTSVTLPTRCVPRDCHGLAAFIGLLVVAWRAARRLPTAFETDAARGLVLALASGSVFNSLLLDHTEGMLFSWLVAVLYGGYRRSEPAAVGRAREVDAVERR